MHKILVVNMNYMGDALLTTPAIAVLRNVHPEAQIDTVVGAGAAAQVLEGNPDIDSIFVRRDRGSWGRLVQLYSLLRAGRYHEVVILPPLPAYCIAAYLARTPVRVGLGAPGMAPLLTHGQHSNSLHMADRLLDTVRVPEAARPAARTLKVDLSQHEIERADSLLSGAGVVRGRSLIVFNVGATRPQKCWIPEQVAKVIQGLTESTCLLVGAGSEDLQFSRAVAEASGPAAPVNLVDRTTVKELAAILARADLLISADSGPMHLATAVGTPVIALFGSTDPACTGPYDDHSTVILHRLSCSPCNNHPTCDGRYDCMRQITADEVLFAVRAHLQMRPDPTRVALTMAAGRRPESESPRQLANGAVVALEEKARPGRVDSTISRKRKRSGVGKVLIATKFRFIGDTLVAIPILRAARELWPDAQIALLTGKNARAMLQNNPYLDEIIEFDPTGSDRGTGPLTRLVGKLRRDRYDVSIALNRSFHSALIPWLSGVPLRAGFDSEGRGMLLNRKVGYDRDKSEIECYFDVLQAAEPSIKPDPTLELWVSTEEREEARRLIDTIMSGAESGGRVLGLQPGATIEGKRWPVERFAALADRLAAQYPKDKLVLVGGPDEVESAQVMMERVAPETRTRLWSFVGVCNLRLSLGVLTYLDMLIGNDTAIMHAAVALGRPTVALFGPTNPRKWGHYGKNDRVVAGAGGQMASIDVDSVFRAAQSVLNSM